MVTHQSGMRMARLTAHRIDSLSLEPRTSVSLGYKLSSSEGGLVVVGAFHPALWQLYLLARHRLVGQQIQDVPSTIEPRALLVVRTAAVPGRPASVARFDGQVAGARRVKPLAARREVHRAELPLAQGILHARLEPALLLFVAHLEPDLNQLDARSNNVSLDFRAKLEELLVLFLGAEAHDV